jgi:hypothetical protein
MGEEVRGDVEADGSGGAGRNRVGVLVDRNAGGAIRGNEKDRHEERLVVIEGLGVGWRAIEPSGDRRGICKLGERARLEERNEQGRKAFHGRIRLTGDGEGFKTEGSA